MSMTEQPEFETLPCGHGIRRMASQAAIEDLQRFYGIAAADELEMVIKAERARHTSGQCLTDGQSWIQSRGNAEGEREFWLMRDGKEVQKLGGATMSLPAQESLIESLRKDTGVTARAALDLLGVIDHKFKGK